MKKKKLKKKIEDLKIRVDQCFLFNRQLKSRIDTLETYLTKYKEAIMKLQQENRYYKEWMDRSGVDYKSWFNFEEKTCETCDYPGMSGCGVPCKDCSANPANKKENNNG